MSIGEEIRELREEKDWSQSDLASKAGVDASILSRLESGFVKNPSRETIKKLAKALGVTSSRLLRQIKETRDDTESALLRIGFGHCIWAAPIIALVMETRIAGLKVTSYGHKKSGNDEAIYEPFWYDATELKRGKAIKAGPSYVKGSDIDRLPNVEDWSTESDLKAFTADDLVHLLLADEVDCIMVPGEHFKPYSSLLIRSAYIMNTARSGCSLLAIGNDLNKEKKYENFETLLKNVQTGINGPQVTTFFARGTIAERQLGFYLSQYAKDLRQFYLDLGDWEKSWFQLKATLETEGGLFFIGWEPQLSWIQKKVKEFNKKLAVIEDKLPDLIPSDQLLDKRDQYLTFEIMFKRTSKWLENVETNNNLKNFFALINASISEISTITNEQSPVVRLIAKYLDMESAACFKSLTSLNFSLRFYPDWIEYLQRD
jgi:transcriptional regulator with XRE-family HTH domain